MKNVGEERTTVVHLTTRDILKESNQMKNQQVPTSTSS